MINICPERTSQPMVYTVLLNAFYRIEGLNAISTASCTGSTKPVTLTLEALTSSPDSGASSAVKWAEEY